MKKIHLILGVLLVILLLIGFAGEEGTSENINWKPSFSKSARRPYGSYILYENLNDLFPGATVTSTKRDIYNFLFSDEYYNKRNKSVSNSHFSYIFINETFEISDLEEEKLAYFVEKGNNAFIVAYRLSENIEKRVGVATTFGSVAYNDSLKITADYFLSSGAKPKNPLKYSPTLMPICFDLVKQKKEDELKLKMGGYYTYYDNKYNCDTLGVNSNKEPVFIRIKHGKGYYYICTHPYVFTNQMMLHPKHNYYDFVATLLSHVENKGTIIWDEYYKVDNLERIAEGRNEMMRYIYSQSSLSWALYLLIVTVVLYVLVQMKRTQRVIPVINPLKNSTLEFTETIGRLYFQHQAHKNIAEKRTRFFLEYLRAHYFIRTQTLDEAFCEVVASKTGVSLQAVKVLVQWIDAIKSSHSLSENDLISFSALLDDFYLKSSSELVKSMAKHLSQEKITLNS